MSPSADRRAIPHFRAPLAPARPGRQRSLALTVVALGTCGLHVALPSMASGGDDLASHFATAPEALPDGRQLVDVSLNTISYGTLLIRVVRGGVVLPANTVASLGIAARAPGDLDLSKDDAITSHFDAAAGKLALIVPASRLAARRFAPAVEAATATLSPETWGGYVEYDLNARHVFGASDETKLFGSKGTTGLRPSIIAYGGSSEVHVVGPDLDPGFGSAYDTSSRSDPVVRLDDTVTWRPRSLEIAVAAGDVVSGAPGTLAQARAYRFGGLQIGTDHSGTPGWSGSPVRSVTGTAQAQSSVDVYLDGQRTYHADTPGGPFSLALPPGATGVGTNVVVTDATGRAVVLPVEVARVDAQLLRPGLMLWSAGLGAPRFAYGSSQTRYDRDLYGNANARFGVIDTVTATLHAEGGTRLGEAEFGGDVAITPWLTTQTAVAGSLSARGKGGSGHIGFVLRGWWNLEFQVQLTRTLKAFDDVVSASARRTLSATERDLPTASNLSGRLSWQANPRLSLSASYQTEADRGSADVGFASLGANYLLADGKPLFANLSHAVGGRRDTTILAGLSFTFGTVHVSSSAGYQYGGDRTDSVADRDGRSGGLTASKALGSKVGDVGFDAYSTTSSVGTFANADAQVRTGYGIPGIAAQSFGKQVAGYATLKGSTGVVGEHPFVADPVTGGLIVADAGRPGVPVQLNGYDRGATAFDGKAVLTDVVPGVPQRVAIDTAHMPLDAVPSETDRSVTVRDGGAVVATFGVRTYSSSARLAVTYRGAAPPVGSVLVSAGGSVPIGKEGRAFLPAIARGEVLTVRMPDGTSCVVRTNFDGNGGVGRRIGSFACQDAS